VHEYSIVQALIQRVEAEVRAQGAVAVHRLTVRIGDLAGVERDLLKTAFDTFRERTVCAGAELDITPVAAEWVCPRCRRPIAAGQILRCVECGLPARLEAGDEIVLERIEMEVADV
jgi:hydrogenase nickel incorporation protein HypA/HybF